MHLAKERLGSIAAKQFVNSVVHALLGLFQRRYLAGLHGIAVVVSAALDGFQGLCDSVKLVGQLVIK